MAVANVLDQPDPKTGPVLFVSPAASKPQDPQDDSDNGGNNLPLALQQMLVDLLKALSDVLKLFAKDMQNSASIANSFQQLSQVALQAAEDEQVKINQELDEKEAQEKSSGILGDILGGLGILVGFMCGGILGAMLMATLFVMTTPGLIPGTGSQSVLDMAVSKIGGPAWLQGLIRVLVIVVVVVLVACTGNEAGAAEEAAAGGAELGAEAGAEAGASAGASAGAGGSAAADASAAGARAGSEAADEAAQSSKSFLQKLYDKIPKGSFMTTTTAAQLTQSLNPVYYFCKAAGDSDDKAEQISMIFNIIVSILSLICTDFSAAGSSSFTQLVGSSAKARGAMKIIGLLTALTQISKAGLDISTGLIQIKIGDMLYEMSKFKGFLAALQSLEKAVNDRIDGLETVYKGTVQEQNDMANDFQTWSQPGFAAANAMAANIV